jgi:hypothetical protein
MNEERYKNTDAITKQNVASMGPKGILAQAGATIHGGFIVEGRWSKAASDELRMTNGSSPRAYE